MKLQHDIAIVLSLPIVVCGDSLRGTQETEENIQRKGDTAEVDHKERRLITKMTAAQKRQIQRDNRRQRLNPFRGEDEELRERARKRKQAIKRDAPWAEPNNEDYGPILYREGREINRYHACKTRGEACDYVADLPTYERLVERDVRRADRRARRARLYGVIDYTSDDDYDYDYELGDFDSRYGRARTLDLDSYDVIDSYDDYLDGGYWRQ